MQIRTETMIDAPASTVWQVLTDFRAYGQWNPFILSIRGDLVEGEQLQVVVHQPGGRELGYHPKVLKVVPGEQLRWRARLMFGGLFDGEHYFLLEERQADDGSKQTRLIQGEDFSGWLVKWLTRSLHRTARGFAAMNQAIKKRAEAVA